jgi:hypothetical protein
MSPSADDRVDRPPRETRRKKGQNHNRRRRKANRLESTVAVIDSLLLAPVQITFNGQATNVSALEAIMCQLLQKALSGSGRAFQVLLKYQEFASRHGEKKLELTFVDSEYTRTFANQRSRGDDA